MAIPQFVDVIAILIDGIFYMQFYLPFPTIFFNVIAISYVKLLTRGCGHIYRPNPLMLSHITVIQGKSNKQWIKLSHNEL